MKLQEAQEIIREVDGKSYWWLKAWGLSIIREAIRTIAERKSSTDADAEIASSLKYKIIRGYYGERGE